MKVLVVDDTSSIRELLAELLRTNGYEVIEAESGVRALEICKNEMIPMIISDIKMPGLSGIEFCIELRKFNPISFALALTSYQKLFHVAECRSAGFDDYLKKPFEQAELLKRVEMGAHKVKQWIAIESSKAV